MISSAIKRRNSASGYKEHLAEIDEEIAAKNKAAEELPFNDLMGKDAIYQEVDKLKKDRDKKIEEVIGRNFSRSICCGKRNSPSF